MCSDIFVNKWNNFVSDPLLADINKIIYIRHCTVWHRWSRLRRLIGDLTYLFLNYPHVLFLILIARKHVETLLRVRISSPMMKWWWFDGSFWPSLVLLWWASHGEYFFSIGFIVEICLLKFVFSFVTVIILGGNSVMALHKCLIFFVYRVYHLGICYSCKNFYIFSTFMVFKIKTEYRSHLGSFL